MTGPLTELAGLPRARAALDAREVELIEEALDAGETFTSLAAVYGFTPQAMGQRYRKLGGTRALPPGRPPKMAQPRGRDLVGQGASGAIRDPA